MLVAKCGRVVHGQVAGPASGPFQAAGALPDEQTASLNCRNSAFESMWTPSWSEKTIMPFAFARRFATTQPCQQVMSLNPVMGSFGLAP